MKKSFFIIVGMALFIGGVASAYFVVRADEALKADETFKTDRAKNATEYEILYLKATNFSDFMKRYKLNFGENPSSMGKLLAFAKSIDENSVSTFSFDEYNGKKGVVYTPFSLYSKRPNGEPYGSPKTKNTSDVLASSRFYLNREDGTGFVLEILDDYSIQKIPRDKLLFTYEPSGKSTGYAFYGQSGVSSMLSLHYEELFAQSPSGMDDDYIGKPTGEDIIPDNGGPEGVIRLSRRLAVSNANGIDREQLWQVFPPDKSEFNLLEVQNGASKLELQTQVEHRTLSQLQASGSPALLFLQDDGRIVTLTAIDDDRAVVIDRGHTRNVERSVLEKRYSGEALVPTKAVTQNAAIVTDDAVREVKLPSLEAEVPQQFVLRNTGTQPITLQLEYPLLGVTESKLSRDVIPPGEAATLDLKVKWRSILKAPYQNVLVSVATNDPIVPRLQLALLLTPPANAGK